MSVAVQAAADGVYDGSGIVDVTFGPGARLAMVSSTRHLAGGPWFNPGAGVRERPGRTPTVVLSGVGHRPENGSPAATSDGGIHVRSVLDAPGTPVDGRLVELTVTPVDGGIDVTESLPGFDHHPVLFLPYPSDLGDGMRTRVTMTASGAVLEQTTDAGTETLELIIDAEITGRLDLADDYQNRRGTCGVLRFDLAGPATGISWHLRHTAAESRSPVAAPGA